MKVDDRVWRQLKKKLENHKKAEVKVGILQSGNAAKDHGEGISMVELAAIHEFGSPAKGIPERSWIRAGVESNKDEIGRITGKLAESVVYGTRTVEQALDTLGIKAAAMIKNHVASGAHIKPPLSPKTIAKKGSTRPLIDTGRMYNAVTHEVVKK